MKRTKIVLTSVLTLALVAVLIGCATGDDVTSKKKGVYTVNTTLLSEQVKG